MCMCVAGAQQQKRSGHGHITRPTQHSNTHRRASCQVYEAHSSRKKQYRCRLMHIIHIIGTPVLPLFDLRRPRDIKSTPSRRGTLYVYGKYALFWGVHAVLRRPRLFSSALGCGESKGPVGTILRLVWIPVGLGGACSGHSKSLSWLF